MRQFRDSFGSTAGGRLARHLRRNAVAYLALFIALGGTSYAALKLPKNSVGTKQIKSKAVTKAKIDPKALASLKGPAGANGAPGAKGDKGDKGDRGIAGGTGAPSNSVSADPADVPMAATDTVLLTTTITTGSQQRIVVNALGVFHDAANTGTLSCVANITPQGGSTTAMGQRYDLRFITLGGAFTGPTPASGAIVEPAGTYTVDFACKQTAGTTGDIVFERGDLSVIAVAP